MQKKYYALLNMGTEFVDDDCVCILVYTLGNIS